MSASSRCCAPSCRFALEKAPRGVAGLDDARARGPQVVELCEQLGLQPLVIDGEARGGADVPCELLLGDGATRMNDEGDLPAVANDRCDNPVRPGDGAGTTLPAPSMKRSDAPIG